MAWALLWKCYAGADWFSRKYNHIGPYHASFIGVFHRFSDPMEEEKKMHDRA
jgi:hypothetical protein